MFIIGFSKINIKKGGNTTTDFVFYAKKDNEIFEIINDNLKLVNHCNSMQYIAKENIVFYKGIEKNIPFEKFRKSARAVEERVVYIYTGPSGLGKTYLTYEKDKFETDAYDILPNEIEENIIVLGNRHNYKYEDILSRIDRTNTKIIKVELSIS